MNFRQETFDVDKYESRKKCILAKNTRAKELRGEGYKVVSCILKNQERGYLGFGGPAKDFSTRDIFMITIYPLP